MILQVRRWFPEQTIILVGDGAYAVVSLALCCAGLSNPVSLVSRLRMDAALYDFPPQNQPVKRGPKPKKGARQRSLKARIDDPSTIWTAIEVIWYGGLVRTMEVISGVCLWYTPGLNPVPIKWVVVRDPEGKIRTEAFFSANTDASEKQIINWFILRWNIEVTFEELRAHLGVETQRQWSDKAISRATPCLFALFSIIVLMAIEILKGKAMPALTSAWYSKREATFSDVIALVRKHIWSAKYFVNSSKNEEFTNLNDDFFKSIIETLCYMR